MKSDVPDAQTSRNAPGSAKLSTDSKADLISRPSTPSVKTDGVKRDDRSVTPTATPFSPSTYPFLSYSKEAFTKGKDENPDAPLPAGMWPYGVQAGAPKPSSFDFEFSLHDEEWVLLQQWNEKHYTTRSVSRASAFGSQAYTVCYRDVSNTICISLGCYLAADAQKAQREDPLVSLSDMISRIQPKPWPLGRLVYAQVNDGNSWLVDSLPDIVSQLSSGVGPGGN